MSDLLANIYLIDFDREMKTYCAGRAAFTIGIPTIF